jgi:F0F1-type ATP synthase assembly protein I
MKALAGAIGGMVLGGAAGWFLPRLVISQPHEFEALGLLVLQTFGLGIGATAGLIIGGALAAKYWQQTRSEKQEAQHKR